LRNLALYLYLLSLGGGALRGIHKQSAWLADGHEVSSDRRETLIPASLWMRVSTPAGLHVGGRRGAGHLQLLPSDGGPYGSRRGVKRGAVLLAAADGPKELSDRIAEIEAGLKELTERGYDEKLLDPLRKELGELKIMDLENQMDALKKSMKKEGSSPGTTVPPAPTAADRRGEMLDVMAAAFEVADPLTTEDEILTLVSLCEMVEGMASKMLTGSITDEAWERLETLRADRKRLLSRLQQRDAAAYERVVARLRDVFESSLPDGDLPVTPSRAASPRQPKKDPGVTKKEDDPVITIGGKKYRIKKPSAPGEPTRSDPSPGTSTSTRDPLWDSFGRRAAETRSASGRPDNLFQSVRQGMSERAEAQRKGQKELAMTSLQNAVRQALQDTIGDDRVLLELRSAIDMASRVGMAAGDVAKAGEILQQVQKRRTARVAAEVAADKAAAERAAAQRAAAERRARQAAAEERAVRQRAAAKKSLADTVEALLETDTRWIAKSRAAEMVGRLREAIERAASVGVAAADLSRAKDLLRDEESKAAARKAGRPPPESASRTTTGRPRTGGAPKTSAQRKRDEELREAERALANAQLLSGKKRIAAIRKLQIKYHPDNAFSKGGNKEDKHLAQKIARMANAARDVANRSSKR